MGTRRALHNQIPEVEKTTTPAPVPDQSLEAEEPGSDDDRASVASVTGSVASVRSCINKAKKAKIVADLSPDEEQAMIDWLQDHPILYNKKLGTYKDTVRKEALWAEKAVALKKPIQVLKTWYTSLRTRFGRLKKKKSGDGDPEMTEREEWILRHFEFLRPYMYEVKKRTAVSVSYKFLINQFLCILLLYTIFIIYIMQIQIQIHKATCFKIF